MGCSDSKSTKVETQPKAEPSRRQAGNVPESENESAAQTEPEETTKPTIVLYYFGFRGRVEPIRLILHYSGVKFEDRRLTQEEWGARKKNGEYCGTFGQMPWAEMNGEIVCQSKALLRFAARQGGVIGETAWETAKADCLVDTLSEHMENLGTVFFAEDPATAKADLVNNKLPAFLKRMELTLKANNDGKGYLVGNKITHADFVFCDLYETLEKMAKDVDKGDVIDACPLLKEHRQRMLALPQLQEYLKSRPDLPF